MDDSYYTLYEKECGQCEDYYKTLEDVTYHTSRLIRMMYSSEPVDSLKVEGEIDTLCHLLKIKPEENFLRLCRRQQLLDNQIVECLNLNNQYLKKFNGKLYE